MSLSSVHTKHVRSSNPIMVVNYLIVSCTSTVAGGSTQEHCGAGESGGLREEQMLSLSHFGSLVEPDSVIQAMTTGS